MARSPIAALLVLLAAPAAFAAPPHGNAPGLQRICSNQPSTGTVDEAVDVLLEALTDPPECDMAAERGICSFSDSVLLATEGTSMGLVPVDPGLVAPVDGEQPAYEATVLLDHADEAMLYAVHVNGQLLAEGPTSEGEVRIEGRIAPPLSTRLWTHVLVTHRGDRLELPTFFEPQADSTMPRALLSGGKGWSNGGPVTRFDYDLGTTRVEGRLADDDSEPVRVHAVISVTYTNAGQ